MTLSNMPFAGRYWPSGVCHNLAAQQELAISCSHTHLDGSYLFIDPTSVCSDTLVIDVIMAGTAGSPCGAAQPDWAPRPDPGDAGAPG